jgi:ssDNA-binding Zn-finger/Zn-ribbon topoisomerase 1
MDRQVFKLPFTTQRGTNYQCPTCGKGNLIIKEGTFHQRQTKSTLDSQDHPEYSNDWDETIYSCLFECSNTACNDVIASSGRGRVEEEYDIFDDGSWGRVFETWYFPKIFTPNLKVFICPEGTPEDVEGEIDKSFSLIFIDPASSANHIRVALEHLLTFMRIKRYETKRGRRVLLSLHKRIQLLPEKFENIKDIFLAAKWLGNAGSHSNHQVTRDDVLDSYELTIEILDKVFSNKTAKARALAKKINKKKGPK